ncbi:MAG: acyl-CoA desaturase [Pseudomonadota bacterium]
MPPTYSPCTGFRRDLEARVSAYFAEGPRARHGNRNLHFKTGVLLVWLAASYALLVWGAHVWWQAVPLAISLALAMAGVGFNIQHDGNHGAYSSHAGVNRAAALSLNLLGGDAYFWRFKHNIAHHSYPNVSGSDDDIRLGPMARLSPHDRRYWFHRFQHLYIWGLYALLALNWQLSGDFRSLIRPGVADTRVARPSGWDLASFCAGKACFLTLAFLIPLLHHGVGAVIGLYLLTTCVLGFTLAVVFQLAHCVEEATFRVAPAGTKQIGRDFAAHQVETSVDFARDSRLLTWYLGGLNYQIEHHLFPKTCHVHYPALSPIIEATCQQHGIAYRSHPTMRKALRSHVRWLRRMGGTTRPSPDREPHPSTPEAGCQPA